MKDENTLLNDLEHDIAVMDELILNYDLESAALERLDAKLRHAFVAIEDNNVEEAEAIIDSMKR